MNLGEIKAESARLLNDVGYSRWSEAVLTIRANLGMDDVLIETSSIKTPETLTPVAATETVSVDSDTIDVIRVDIMNADSEWKKLKGILRDQLDFEDPNWQQREDGEPIVYWWDGTNQVIHLVPAPSSEWAQTNGLKVWEVIKPTALSSNSDVPFDSNSAMIPYHMALVHYIVSLCWMDDGTPEALAKARFHRSNDYKRPGEYEREIAKIRRRFDAPEDIQARILWRPEGGRATKNTIRTKDNPLAI